MNITILTIFRKQDQTRKNLAAILKMLQENLDAGSGIFVLEKEISKITSIVK